MHNVRARTAAMAVFVACLALACCAAGGQDRISGDRKTASYAELLAMEQHARSDRISRQETFRELTQIGHEYYRLGDFGKSLSLFQEVFQSTDADDAARIDSARMVGQINLFAKNDPAKAAIAYGDMVKMAESSKAQDVIASRSTFLGEGYEKLAIAYQSQGQYDKSTAARREMLAKGMLSPDRRVIGILENARDYLKAKNYAESLATYNLLEKDFPEYGRGDGRIVNIQLERIEAYGLDRNDPQRIDLLLAIWRDESNEKYPQILNVGREIVGLADFLDQGGVAVAIANEWLRRYEQNFSTLPLADKQRMNIDTAYGQVVITLAAWLERKGDYITAIALYERFLKLFPNSTFSEYARKTLDRLYRDKLLYDRDENMANIDSFPPSGAMQGSASPEALSDAERTLGTDLRHDGAMNHLDGAVATAAREAGGKWRWWWVPAVGIVVASCVALGVYQKRRKPQ